MRRTIAQVRAILTSIGNGVEHKRAPGLAARLPAPHGRASPQPTQTATAFQWLGNETIGSRHFNADPR